LADKLNIQGTPAFVIGTELLAGAASFDDFIAAFKRAPRRVNQATVTGSLLPQCMVLWAMGASFAWR
jgi:hypothetical protein